MREMSTPRDLPALPDRGISEGPDGRRWTGGPIQKIHEIGDYRIVEYLQDMNGVTAYSHGDHGKTRFTPYHKDDKWKCLGWRLNTLEEAIIHAIAEKRCGPNGGPQVARMFELMTRGTIPEDD